MRMAGRFARRPGGRRCALIGLALSLAVDGHAQSSSQSSTATTQSNSARPVYTTVWAARQRLSELELLALARSANAYERQYAVLQLGERAEQSDPSLRTVATRYGTGTIPPREGAHGGCTDGGGTSYSRDGWSIP